MERDKKIVAICVATFKRPELLHNCLSHIGRIIVPKNYSPIIIVVDNDADGSGEQSFYDAVKSIEIESYYYVESQRGISSARNRLLKEAVALNTNYVSFIDDDEFPDDKWLVNNIEILKKHGADVIAGPVLPVKNKDKPKPSYSKKKLNDGDSPRHVACGNVFFSTKLVSEQNLWFDAKYNFIGGEDFDFFDRSLDLKNKHVWSSKSIIYEIIPDERTTKKYLFFRHFTGAINNVIQFKMKHTVLNSWIHFIIKSIGKILGSLYLAIAGVLTMNNAKLEKSIIRLASALGYMSGLLNIIIERYR